MRHFHWMTVCLSLLLLAPLPATAQLPEPKADLGANAAIKYWQAFGMLPAMDKEQEKLLLDWQKAPFDAAALKLIDQFAASRASLRRGAELPHCDWSLDYEQGIFLRMPHSTKALTLARLTALHARREFDQRRWQAGWDDVTDMLKLARHVETDAIMINQLVGYAIRAMAIEAAAPHLPDLKPVLPDAVVAELDALPTGKTVAQMLKLEKQTGPVWMIRRLKEAEQRMPGAWQVAWKEILAAPAEGDAAQQALVNSAKTYEQAVKLLEDLLPVYDQLAKLTALPWREFDAKYPELLKQAKAANPLAGSLLPALHQVIAAQRRTETRMTLFKAAIAVVQAGPDNLKDFRDPFGDGPFEHRALDKGFELRSRLLYRDQPVTLTVGKGKKE